MKGWFLPYRIVNVTGVCFIGLRIAMHVIWLNAWVNYTVLLVASILIATQILRNQVKSEQQRPLSIKLTDDKQCLYIEADAMGNDVFNSMGNRSNVVPKWYANIPVSRIVWIEHTQQMHYVIHISDGSYIAGTVSNANVCEMLKNILK